MEAWAIIREARRRSGLTQRVLAARAGTSQAAIARYERRRAIPRLPALARIVRACGFRLDVRLAPVGSDEDALIDQMLQLSVDERLRGAARYADLARHLQGG